MPAIAYECAVDKSHPKRKFMLPQQFAPSCCGKAMVLVQSEPTTGAGTQKPSQPAPKTPTTPKHASDGGKTAEKR